MPIPLVARAHRYLQQTAVVGEEGAFTYAELLQGSARSGSALLGSEEDLREERVAFLLPAGFRYLAVQWGIWRAGGIAVPLALSHPQRELEYVVADAAASLLVAARELAPRLEPLSGKDGRRLVIAEDMLTGAERALPEIANDRAAMIIYTSGTTAGPKGVVTTHDNIRAQIESLVEAWEWTPSDRILLVLPLHHVHGIINVLGCALWSGASCETMTAFDSQEVWSRFERGGLTLFMAVPTIYAKLARHWKQAPAEQRRRWSLACRGFRLMVSGSAALPVGLFESWREISGRPLLERYGMTEIGMALANPLHGERLPGRVGRPLPGVMVRCVDESGREVEPGVPGELEVKAPGVFREYWRRPAETEAAFRHGWFRTGDVAVIDQGSYRILGRQSVDIIKTGGYKVSALEIEEILREHPQIVDCAVVGLPDEEWGERVAAVVVPLEGAQLTLDELRAWTLDRLAPYKSPTRLLLAGELPRNALGKVIKPELKQLFREPATGPDD